MMSSFPLEKSEQFCIAARNGDLQLVETLSLDPEVNLNWRDRNGFTPFSSACLNGHADLVQYMLEFKKRSIDYNLADNFGYSPLLKACFGGHERVVELLVADENIDVNMTNNYEKTPLWMGSYKGHVGVVKLLLASGRHIDTFQRDYHFWKTAAEISVYDDRQAWSSEETFQERKKRGLVISSLLESFATDPEKVRAQVREELYGPLAGELFALVVYISDGYLEIHQGQGDSPKARTKVQQFFSLALRLPLDLQMVLCRRAFGLEGAVVKSIHAEAGFRKFARDH